VPVFVVILFFLFDFALPIDDDVDGVVGEVGADPEQEVAGEYLDLHGPLGSNDALRSDGVVDVEVEKIFLLFRRVERLS
jgi:hypothetical protein